MGYDRGDSFLIDFEPNGNPFGSKSFSIIVFSGNGRLVFPEDGAGAESPSPMMHGPINVPALS